MAKQTKGAAASTQQEGHALGLFRPILSYFVSILLPSCVRFSLAYSNTHPYFRLLHIKTTTTRIMQARLPYQR